MKKQNIILLMIGTTVLLIFLTLQVEKLYYFEYPSFLFCYENRIYGIPLFVKKSKTFLSDYIDKHQLPIPSARYDYFIFSKKTIGLIKYVYETGGVGNDIMKFCDVAKKKNIKHEKILYILNLISQGKFTEFQKEVWSLYYGKDVIQKVVDNLEVHIKYTRKNLAALLRLRTACRGGCGKVRANGKKQRKSPCEAVL